MHEKITAFEIKPGALFFADLFPEREINCIFKMIESSYDAKIVNMWMKKKF